MSPYRKCASTKAIKAEREKKTGLVLESRQKAVGLECGRSEKMCQRSGVK